MSINLRPKAFIMFSGSLRYIGPWPSNPAEAWAISLAKWEAVIELGPSIGDGGGATCGLCMYYAGWDEECGSCPVKQYTSRSQCRETAYWDYVRAINPERRILLAKQELAFLKMVKEKFSNKEPQDA